MPKIAVVIACLNAQETLGEALDSLTAQDARLDWEIVLADNGSNDASRSLFESHARAHPEVPMRIVDASRTRGKSYALNTAIRRTEAPNLLFLDADDAVAPGWLAAMDVALDQYPYVCARLDYRYFNTADVMVTRERMTAGDHTRPSMLSHYPFCPFAGGATLGFHRTVFDAVGGFDEALMAVEDTDFCIRVHLQGYRLVFVPQALYRYRLRSTPSAIRQQQRAYARTGVLLRKRYDPTSRGWLSPTWLRPIGAICRWTIVGLAARLRGDMAMRRRIAAKLGRNLGIVEGGVAHGMAPPRRRHQRRLTADTGLSRRGEISG